MSDEALRNYLGVVSFLLAALSFVAGERRDAIASLHKRSNVSWVEKWLTVASVIGLLVVAFALVACSVPVVLSTGLGFHDLLRLHTALRTAFVIGWVLLIAVALALVPLVGRAVRIQRGTAGS
jgi:hypothetical protein